MLLTSQYECCCFPLFYSSCRITIDSRCLYHNICYPVIKVTTGGTRDTYRLSRACMIAHRTFVFCLPWVHTLPRGWVRGTSMSCLDVNLLIGVGALDFTVVHSCVGEEDPHQGLNKIKLAVRFLAYICM